MEIPELLQLYGIIVNEEKEYRTFVTKVHFFIASVTTSFVAASTFLLSKNELQNVWQLLIIIFLFLIWLNFVGLKWCQATVKRVNTTLTMRIKLENELGFCDEKFRVKKVDWPEENLTPPIYSSDRKKHASSIDFINGVKQESTERYFLIVMVFMGIMILCLFTFGLLNPLFL